MAGPAMLVVFTLLSDKASTKFVDFDASTQATQGSGNAGVDKK